MSRSNPSDQQLPNPSTSFMKWNGTKGLPTTWDRKEEKVVEIALPFTFIPLDILSSVGGYDEDAETDIYSNEVRLIQSDILVVSRRKGAKVATGVYSAIKDTIEKAGARFHNNIYLAYKDAGVLKIGCLKLKGAAVSAWMAFEKKNRAELYKQAIVIMGSDEQREGGITYRTPKFALNPITPETQVAATALDVELQTYLKSVLGRASAPDAPPIPPPPPQPPAAAPQHLRDEDVPFGFSRSSAPPDDDIVPF